MVSVVGGEEHLYSSRMACPECGVNVAQLEPRSFSFNSMYGACPECNGLGSKYDFDPAKVIVDWSKPLLDGGLGPGAGSASSAVDAQARRRGEGIDLATPFEQLPEEQQNFLLYGDRQKRARRRLQGNLAFHKQTLEEVTTEGYREYLMQYMSATPCPVCQGAPAPGEPCREGQRHEHRRVHGASHLARGGGGGAAPAERARGKDRGPHAAAKSASGSAS